MSRMDVVNTCGKRCFNAAYRLLITAPVPIPDNGDASIRPKGSPRVIGCRCAGIAADVDCLRGRPTGERFLADRRYACGDGDTGKVGAIHERNDADRRYTGGERYTGKAGAVGERGAADSFKLAACRKGDGYKACATAERAIIIILNAADSLYACGNGYAGKAGATAERGCADRRYAFADGYAGKAGAAGERIVADRRYACADGYAGKAGAILERIDTDSGYAFTDGYAGKAATILERSIVDTFKLTAFREGDGGKAGAIVERKLADRRYTCGNGYAGNICAAEPTVADSRYGQAFVDCGYNDIAAGYRTRSDAVGVGVCAAGD